MIAAHLRAATTNDGPRIADLFVACRKAMADSGIAPLVNPEDEIRDVFVPCILLREMSVTVGVMDGAVRGFVATRPGWIGHLYVEPGWQGRGLGRILLHHAQRSVDAHDGLQLWTFQANAGAQAFYRRHGFRDAERTDGEHNMERTPDLRMTWSPAAP